MLLLIIQVQMFLQGSGELLQRLYFDRGFFTIFLGHTTLCMAYITVVIRSRLVELDQSLEEAVMDLGARPLKIFFVITLPLIAPAITTLFILPPLHPRTTNRVCPYVDAIQACSFQITS